MKIIFLLLLSVFSLEASQDTSTLKEIFLDASRSDPSQIDIRFVFDRSPGAYPAYTMDFPALFRIDFPGTRLSKTARAETARYLKGLPPPVSSLSVAEKSDDSGAPMTRVVISLDEPLPFTTRWTLSSIYATLTIPVKKGGARVLHSTGKKIAGKNNLKSVIAEDFGDSLEIGIFLSDPIGPYPLFSMDAPPKLVAQFPDAVCDQEVSRQVDMPPLTAFRIIQGGEMISLAFALASETPYAVKTGGNEVRIMLKKAPSGAKKPIWKDKKFIYASAGTVALLTTSIILMTSGREESGGRPAQPTPPPDTWNQPPPDPEDAFK